MEEQVAEVTNEVVQIIQALDGVTAKALIVACIAVFKGYFTTVVICCFFAYVVKKCISMYTSNRHLALIASETNTYLPLNNRELNEITLLIKDGRTFRREKAKAEDEAEKIA